MQDFTNENLDLSLLPTYETVALHQLNKKYWKVILLNIAVFMFFLGMAIYLLCYLLKLTFAESYLLIGGYVMIGILLVTIYKVSMKKRGFAIREKDLIYKSGIISISTSIVPFNRIQHITLNEGVFSRLFHLAALHIFTAGGLSGNIVIPGLDIELAHTIKQELSRQLNQQAHHESSRDTDGK
ncbi:PH domain-containing protein [Pedobacter gandavensis]|uniref:PH domain-containing protein n=1 Tax=Pedobacter gandavensis TaxID=2679963 RepID=UPI00292F2301|nr:PH domain-containing protein [Pedobacter gandavensis]